jgi:hypothetical protein
MCAPQRAPAKRNAQLVHFFGSAGGYAWVDVDKLAPFEPGAAGPELLGTAAAGARAVEHVAQYLDADTDESEVSHRRPAVLWASLVA